jgi:hypothetical protein
LLSMMLTLSL